MNSNLDQTGLSPDAPHAHAENLPEHQASGERPPAVHPGEVLLKEFLRPLGITAYRLAKETRMSQSSIAQLVRKKRTITVRTAVRLSEYFGNPAELWLVLQNNYDLEKRKAAVNKLQSTWALSGPGSNDQAHARLAVDLTAERKPTC
jgi:antitoxin HigA-1